jgi:hypothetical protein
MSPKKSRKSLDDALARQFIYGEKQHGTVQESAPEQTPSELSPEQPSSSNSESVVSRTTAGAPLGATEKTPNELPPLMHKFHSPPKEATVRFTVDLPASMHRKLSILAARTGKKKAEIVRVLLDEALENVVE